MTSSSTVPRPRRILVPGSLEESRAGGILQSRAESQRIAVWWLLYRVQHPGRYLSRLQTDRRSLKPCAALCSVLGSGRPGFGVAADAAARLPALDRLRVWTAKRPGTRAAGHHSDPEGPEEMFRS
jgi:hypothetical protein